MTKKHGSVHVKLLKEIEDVVDRIQLPLTLTMLIFYKKKKIGLKKIKTLLCLNFAEKILSNVEKSLHKSF